MHAPARQECSCTFLSCCIVAQRPLTPFSLTFLPPPQLLTSLQEYTLSSQYLSAMSAHFIYWSSHDVAQLLLRASKGLDVLTGEPETVDAADIGDEAQAAAG